MLQKAWRRYLFLFVLTFPLYLTVNFVLFREETEVVEALIFATVFTIIWAVMERKMPIRKENR
ncbi:hypothetical protein [Salimicrobium halophilum]|uniref:Uncharacterized protein n=1 Tax=Salimicrobium halophilum TaxID=86666 RepID=A0A1G8R4Y7_9BACI|nr:hypothetical protein [Salimicrobium halophilum]SDJ11893.1 hypothetical protein SAMN04490247_0820 [Salimicrobium halophilum]